MYWFISENKYIPGYKSSILIRIEEHKPNIEKKIAEKKYRIPIFLWSKEIKPFKNIDNIKGV